MISLISCIRFCRPDLSLEAVALNSTGTYAFHLNEDVRSCEQDCFRQGFESSVEIDHLPSIVFPILSEKDDLSSQSALFFPPPKLHRCEEYGAFRYGEDCRCPDGQLCRHKGSGKCIACIGTFLAWRRQHRLAADITILGMRLAPRCLFFTLLFNSDQPHIRKIYPIRADGDDGDELDVVVNPTDLEGYVQMMLPHVYFTVTLAPIAYDSFWWIIALACGLMAQFRRELSLLNRRRLTSIELMVDTLMDIIKDICLAACVISLVIFANNVLGEASELNPVIHAWLLTDSIRAVMRPYFLLRKGHHIEGLLHLGLLAFLVGISQNAAFDVLTLFLVGGPGAATVAMLLDDIEALWGSRNHSYVIILDRSRLIKTSVDQLRKLTPRRLTNPPTVIFSARGSSPEPGVDLGGLRRDWLGQFTNELFDPAAGLMESTLLDGTPFAKLRPGGDLRHLEALGKALGLALRDGQSLGIDLCAPQAHMLVHPKLPAAINRIEKSGRGRLEELKKLAFSCDWLQWVSPEEHEFWKSVTVNSRASNELAMQYLYPDGSAPPDINLEVAAVEHMRKRSLDALILDVREELKALWRGLHAIPNLKLPSLADETRAAKRKRDQLQSGQTLERVAKRARTDRSDVRESLEEALQGDGSLTRCRSKLQGMLAGMLDISPAHWKSLTVHAPSRRAASERGKRTIEWFWKYVESLQAQERAELLQWITGYRRMPINGFPPPSTKMILYLTNDSDKHLPCAHTCTLQIDLSLNYESESVLQERLSVATACREFHMA